MMIARPRPRAFALGLVVLLSAISATWAADQTVTLKLGVGLAFAIERPYNSVLIGDPDIVDVHTNNDRSVMLEPLKLGATNLIFLDAKSIAITNIRILVRDAGA